MLTQETQILFEIQGFYFFSNIISKRDVKQSSQISLHSTSSREFQECLHEAREHTLET